MRSRFHSLRGGLLAWLLIPLVVMALTMVAEVYVSARKSVEDLHDRMLTTLAWSISESTANSDGDLLQQEALRVISSSSNENIYYLVTGPDNAYITGYADLTEPPPETRLEGGTPYFYDATYDGQPVRMLLMRYLVEGRDINGWMQVQIAQTRSGRDEQVRDAVVRAASRILAVILLASILAVVGVNQGLSPLNRLQRSIRRRSYSDLRPIDQQMPSEVHHLVQAVNELLARLHESIESQRRFIANASHQLRTPLAALQAEAELALREVADPRAQEALRLIQAGTRQTSRLANQLLTLTRVRSNPAGGRPGERFDLATACREAATEWVPKALARNVDLGFETDGQPLRMQGSEFQIRELLTNLIDNAIRYGARKVTVRTTAEGDHSRVDVVDDGPGIPEAMREQVFERFIRLDERIGDGCGLGLNIVREIAEAHGGRSELRAGDDGLGTCARITLPRRVG